jgi:hypothetical protein
MGVTCCMHWRDQKYIQQPSRKIWGGVGVFGPERESGGGCRELHNEELYDL